MRGTSVLAMAAVLLWAGLPVVAAAQSEESAGVVTTVNGQATLTRAAKLAQPVSLRMRDEIFVRDRIQTQPQSLVRVLLGGKALITVRELSVLTVTEEANRVTVDLQSGKVGVAVVKGRMRPGEVIEIRSPNATAAVRGTVFVVDVDPLPAGRPSTSATTRIHLFQGALDIGTRHGAAQPGVRLAAMQSIVVTGNTLGAVRPLTREAVAAVTADLRPRQVQDDSAPNEFTGQLVTREQGRAIMLASTLLPSVPGGSIQNSLKNVKGTVTGVTGTVSSLTGTVTGGLDDTVTNLTGNMAETLERLMDSLGIGNEGLVAALPGAVGNLGSTAGDTVGQLGDTLGKTVTGLGGTLGGALGGPSGSSPAGPVGALTAPAAPPIAAPTLAVPPLAAPPTALSPPAPAPTIPPLIPTVLKTVGGLLGK